MQTRWGWSVPRDSTPLGKKTEQMDAASKIRAKRAQQKAQRTNSVRDLERLQQPQGRTDRNADEPQTQATDIMKSLLAIHQTKGVNEKRKRLVALLRQLKDMDPAMVKLVVKMVGEVPFRGLLDHSIKGTDVALYGYFMALLKETKSETTESKPEPVVELPSNDLLASVLEDVPEPLVAREPLPAVTLTETPADDWLADPAPPTAVAK